MMVMIARMIRMIMTDSWFKQGFKHGWHVNMRSMRRIITGDYHADKPFYVNPLPSLPSIREWLEQHGGTSMNARDGNWMHAYMIISICWMNVIRTWMIILKACGSQCSHICSLESSFQSS